MKPRMLIVDDDGAARHSLRIVLEAYGYSVRDFASAEDLAQDPMGADSCLILDVDLPGASGLDMLRRLRALGSRVPVVLVSGCATDTIRAEAACLEALAFFEKPIDIDALLRTIDSDAELAALDVS